VVIARADAPRLVAPSQLDAVETCFAMTVHKSQGSEYAAVAVVLPPATSPLLTRELLTTAITRAKAELLVVGTEAAVREAVRSPSGRASGLRHTLG
jgi:exodeoxyribonuclease V alpha subunit